jgi:hypothetical protein
MDEAKAVLDLGGAVIGVVAAVISLLSIVVTLGADIPLLLGLATAVAALYSAGWSGTMTDEAYTALRVALYNACNEDTGLIDAVGFECLVLQLEDLPGTAYVVFKICSQLMRVAGLNNTLLVTPNQNGGCVGYDTGACAVTWEHTFDFTTGQHGFVPGEEYGVETYEPGVGFVGAYVPGNPDFSGVSVKMSFPEIQVDGLTYGFTRDGGAVGQYNHRRVSGWTNGSVVLSDYDRSTMVGENEFTKECNVAAMDEIRLGAVDAFVNTQYIAKFVILRGRRVGGDPFL